MASINIVTAVNGTVNVPLHITGQIVGTNIKWESLTPNVLFTVSTDNQSLNFTPKADGTYQFKVTADTTSRVIVVTVGSVTPPNPTPTPNPTPNPTPTPSGNVLWDSIIHGKWNETKTITVKEGQQKPNDKSIFCAASGKPKLVVSNGVGTIVSGKYSSENDNISVRQRSRHQGELNNVKLAASKRFGGHGWAYHRDGSIGFATEDYHNVHSGKKGFKSPVKLNDGKWHTAVQILKGNKSSTSVDGKKVGEVTVSNHGDDSLLPKNSYIWFRNNNSDNGRIYIVAINVDSELRFDFKLNKGTVDLRNVRLSKI